MKICTRCGKNPQTPHKSWCRACASEYQREWHKKNRDAQIARMRVYYRANKEKWAGSGQRSYRKLREAVLDAYGHCCACCGETTSEFLTVDHINGDGAEHRRQMGTQKGAFYRWLRREGFPTDRFQLLCFNCNCAKGLYGSCPHERAEERSA